jgi:hypothetical protein
MPRRRGDRVAATLFTHVAAPAQGVLLPWHSSHIAFLTPCPLSVEADMRALGWNAVYDPTETLAVHCGNGFDADFSPYQSTRLSRYNAGP